MRFKNLISGLGLMLLACSQFVSAQLGSAIWLKGGKIVCGLYYGFVLIAGGLATLMIVYAGVKWLTSADDPGERKNAKDMIKHAIIALLLILAAAGLMNILVGGEVGFGSCG